MLSPTDNAEEKAKTDRAPKAIRALAVHVLAAERRPRGQAARALAPRAGASALRALARACLRRARARASLHPGAHAPPACLHPHSSSAFPPSCRRESTSAPCSCPCARQPLCLPMSPEHSPHAPLERRPRERLPAPTSTTSSTVVAVPAPASSPNSPARLCPELARHRATPAPLAHCRRAHARRTPSPRDAAPHA